MFTFLFSSDGFGTCSMVPQVVPLHSPYAFIVYRLSSPIAMSNQTSALNNFRQHCLRFTSYFLLRQRRRPTRSEFFRRGLRCNRDSCCRSRRRSSFRLRRYMLSCLRRSSSRGFLRRASWRFRRASWSLRQVRLGSGSPSRRSTDVQPEAMRCGCALRGHLRHATFWRECGAWFRERWSLRQRKRVCS